jgi:hypothetical protein
MFKAKKRPKTTHETTIATAYNGIFFVSLWKIVYYITTPPKM